MLCYMIYLELGNHFVINNINFSLMTIINHEKYEKCEKQNSFFYFSIFLLSNHGLLDEWIDIIKLNIYLCNNQYLRAGAGVGKKLYGAGAVKSI